VSRDARRDFREGSLGRRSEKHAGEQPSTGGRALADIFHHRLNVGPYPASPPFERAPEICLFHRPDCDTICRSSQRDSRPWPGGGAGWFRRVAFGSLSWYGLLRRTAERHGAPSRAPVHAPRFGRTRCVDKTLPAACRAGSACVYPGRWGPEIRGAASIARAQAGTSRSGDTSRLVSRLMSSPVGVVVRRASPQRRFPRFDVPGRPRAFHADRSHFRRALGSIGRWGGALAHVAPSHAS